LVWLLSLLFPLRLVVGQELLYVRGCSAKSQPRSIVESTLHNQTVHCAIDPINRATTCTRPGILIYNNFPWPQFVTEDAAIRAYRTLRCNRLKKTEWKSRKDDWLAVCQHSAIEFCDQGFYYNFVERKRIRSQGAHSQVGVIIPPTLPNWDDFKWKIWLRNVPSRHRDVDCLYCTDWEAISENPFSNMPSRDNVAIARKEESSPFNGDQVDGCVEPLPYADYGNDGSLQSFDSSIGSLLGLSGTDVHCENNTCSAQPKDSFHGTCFHFPNREFAGKCRIETRPG
jgi:hypothetical protein